MTTTELIAQIKGPDEKARGEAWQSAGPLGAPAVKPLAGLMTAPEQEIARAAKRALWKVVRHAGRPGQDAKAVAGELVPLLGAGDINARRELVWMLSEIGGDDAVEPVAALLSVPGLREDARAALQRIPGRKSLAALNGAFKQAPEEYKAAIAVSLRVRGETVTGYPPAKLVPVKKTAVKPANGASPL